MGAEQVVWLNTTLATSTADWQIIVTHFPPETAIYFPYMIYDLKDLGERFGIDLVVSGHRHVQGLYESGDNDFSDTAGIPYVVTGGGGGITSETKPSDSEKDGGLDQYGFMDMTISKTGIRIEAINEWGASRGTMRVKPRPAKIIV